MYAVKRIILFLFGLSPFLFGLSLNALLTWKYNLILPYKIIGIVFLFGWSLLGFLTYSNGGTVLKPVAIVNIPAFIVLLLLIYQEIVLGHYWFNTFGLATQFFFLPLLSISYSLTFWTHYVWPAYIVSFLLMFGAFVLGYYVKSVAHNKKFNL